MITFDKLMPIRLDLWVDSVTGIKVRRSEGMQAVKILAQKFHPQELNYDTYMELSLLLNSSQIDELINTLQRLKAAGK